MEIFGNAVSNLKRLFLIFLTKRSVFHDFSFQLYLRLTMELNKLQRLLKFDQSVWLKNILILILTKGKAAEDKKA